MKLSGVEQQILAELHAGARRFNAFVTPLSTGWRDGDGRQLPEAESVRERLAEEISRMQEHLDRARAGLQIQEESHAV